MALGLALPHPAHCIQQPCPIHSNPFQISPALFTFMPMADRLFPNSLFNHGANSTTGHTSLLLASSSTNLNRSEKANDPAALDVNLSLNSGYSANNLAQNQPVPVLGQLGLHRHVAQGRLWRKGLTVISGTRDHSTANSQSTGNNNVNLNIFMGNNSSININVLNNQTPLQFTRNNQFTSSSIAGQLRNNVLYDASSSFKQAFATLATNQESKGRNMPEMNERSQITSSYSLYTPPSVSARTGRGQSTYLPNFDQKIPTAIPLLRQQHYSSSHQQQPQGPQQSSDFQHHAISHSNSNLSLSSLLSSSCPSEKHYRLPSFLDSGINLLSSNRQADFESGNHTLHEGSHHSQPNFLAHPDSHQVRGHVRNQVSDPSTTHHCLSQSHLQSIFQAPSQNAVVTGHQQHLPQHISPNHIIDSSTQAKGRQCPAVRHRSHPYIKYGPYTCPVCRAIFDSRHCFAAHIQKHYREETPMEQKRRRESKIRNRDLSIKNTTAGITVIPKSLSLEDKLLVKSAINGEDAINTKQVEGFALERIKQEVVTQYEN